MEETSRTNYRPPAIHLVKGDGKNGFKKGQYGVTVDADYKSTSNNFQTLQTLANDHSALGVLSVYDNGESVPFRTSLSWSKKNGYTLGNSSLSFSGPGDPANGYTFLQYRGKLEGGELYSQGEESDIAINGTQDSIEIIASIHHELRHLLLGDFGRNARNADHSQAFIKKGTATNNADFETLDAENEAKANAKP